MVQMNAKKGLPSFIASGAREMALVSNYSLLRLCKNGARLCFGAK